MTAREYVLLPEVARNQTSLAFDQMRLFRLSLSQREYPPNLKTFAATNRNYSGSQLIGRLLGLESHYRNVGQEDGGVQIAAGFVIKGADDIKTFLTDLDANVDYVEQLSQHYDPKIPGTSTPLFLATATTLTVPALAYILYQTNGQYGATGFPLFIFFFLVGPENFIRFAASFDYNGLGFIDGAHDFLANSAPGGWRYDAKTYWLPRQILGDLWFKGYLGHNLLGQSRSEVETYFGRKITDSRGVHTYAKDASVQIDRLLRIDPRSGEPEMVLFFRMNVGRPKFPARVGANESAGISGEFSRSNVSR